MIWKFALPEPGGVTVVAALGLEPLCVKRQDGVAKMWASVEEPTVGDTMEEYEVICVGTGWPFDRRFHYIGTLIDGECVWHYLYRKR